MSDSNSVDVPGDCACCACRCCGNRWHWDELTVKHFLTSHFVPTWLLFLLRVVFFCYNLVAFVLGPAASPDYGFIRYFTVQTVLVNLLYFTLQLFGSLVGFYKGYQKPDFHVKAGSRVSCWWRWPWVLFEMAVVNSIAVTILYWALLYNGFALTGTSGATTMLDHGLNHLPVFIDLWLNRLEIIPLHLIINIIYIVCYMFFTWIYWGVSGSWIYYFLNIQHGSNAVWYIMMLVIFLVLHFLYMFFIFLRNKLAMKCGRNQSVSPAAVHGDQEDHDATPLQVIALPE